MPGARGGVFSRTSGEWPDKTHNLTAPCHSLSGNLPQSASACVTILVKHMFRHMSGHAVSAWTQQGNTVYSLKGARNMIANAGSFCGIPLHWHSVQYALEAVFCFLRGDISENIDQNTTEIFEEMGVQTDEDVDVSYEAFSKLQAKKRRM